MPTTPAQRVVADELSKVRGVRLLGAAPRDVTPFFLAVRDVVREALTREAGRSFPFAPEADETAARLHARRQIRLSLAALLCVTAKEPTQVAAEQVELLYDDEASRAGVTADSTQAPAGPLPPRSPPLVVSREGSELYVYEGEGAELSPAVRWEPWNAVEEAIAGRRGSLLPPLTPREAAVVARDRDRAADALVGHTAGGAAAGSWFCGLFPLAGVAQVLIHAVQASPGGRPTCFYASPVPLAWLGWELRSVGDAGGE